MFISYHRYVHHSLHRQLKFILLSTGKYIFLSWYKYIFLLHNHAILVFAYFLHIPQQFIHLSLHRKVQLSLQMMKLDFLFTINYFGCPCILCRERWWATLHQNFLFLPLTVHKSCLQFLNKYTSTNHSFSTLQSVTF